MFPEEETNKTKIKGLDVWITTSAGLVEGSDEAEPKYVGYWSLREPVGLVYGEAPKDDNGKTKLFTKRDDAYDEAHKAATEMITLCQRRGKLAETTITPEQQVNLFLGFCNDLTRHPIIEWSRDHRQTTMSFSFPESGEDKVDVNFDRYHLESLLTRLRQFVSPKEVFYVDAIHDAVDSLIGGKDPDWDDLCNTIKGFLSDKFPRQPFESFKTNGEPVVEGRTYLELLEARLYTGPIHSARIENARSGSSSDGWKDANEVCRDQLNSILVSSSLKVCQNVMNLRRKILDRWIAAGRVPSLPLLDEFEERVAQVER